MSKRLRGFSLVTVVAAFVIGMLAATQHGPAGAQDAASGDIAQGDYIVQQVARCQGCHNTNLQGRPADPKNPAFIPRPKIAGLPMFKTNSDAVTFFQTGLLPAGMRALSPTMPAYRFKASDALAVVAYLRSLP